MKGCGGLENKKLVLGQARGCSSVQHIQSQQLPLGLTMCVCLELSGGRQLAGVVTCHGNGAPVSQSNVICVASLDANEGAWREQHQSLLVEAVHNDQRDEEHSDATDQDGHLLPEAGHEEHLQRGFLPHTFGPCRVFP